ncbi:sulfotransferase [Streptomyces ochraceiscleroticus]|uniref:Sulfotransferase n=1 Tax=Streptomyces ochraceiscleroticus TaxID=47761 RepID=A0ABW1MJH6_9ACTN|nr:sulfotransferase [Streptomyces ochraceiscleroticus]
MTGAIRTLSGDWSPPGGRPVELVLRTLGERTTSLALGLAIRHIRPRKVHVVENIRPLARAVDRQVHIDHGDASHIVYVDADSLILEDLRPFLDANDLAYVDCYVRDRFRGRVHCGVHIARADLVRAMREVDVAAESAWAGRGPVLRPEAFRRHLALRHLQPDVQLKTFHILHDHFQHHTDVFAKYALREVRSRTAWSRAVLEEAMPGWGNEPDFDLGREAVRHTRAAVPADVPPRALARYLESLSRPAADAVARLGLPALPPLTPAEVRTAVAGNPLALGPAPRRPKVFCLGPPGTGVRSLVAALHEIGHDLAHYPLGADDLAALRRRDGAFPALDHYDGLTSSYALPSLPALDARHPGARFILTARPTEDWLRTAERLWRTPWPAGAPRAERAAHEEVASLFREWFDCGNTFDSERLAESYNNQQKLVRAYFADRPGDLLTVDLTAGDGWERLAPFLGHPVPSRPFPHVR